MVHATPVGNPCSFCGEHTAWMNCTGDVTSVNHWCEPKRLHYLQIVRGSKSAPSPEPADYVAEDGEE